MGLILFFSLFLFQAKIEQIKKREERKEKKTVQRTVTFSHLVGSKLNN